MYYQIFSPYGAIESKCSFNEKDPFTGRIIASRITPPRTVDNIKTFLLNQENISNIKDVGLFASALTSESELSDQDRPQILAQGGPGSVADDPMALIIKDFPPSAGDRPHRLPISDPAHSPKQLQPFSPNALCLGGHEPSRFVYTVAFSPDGEKIVSCSQDDTVCIWDVTSGKLATGPISAKAYAVTFSPDGGHIALGCEDRPYVRIWDARTGTPVSLPFDGHKGYVLCVAFSPDGQQIASGSGDSTIRIWDVQRGKVQVGPIKGHTERVRSVAFSPDGVRIVSGSFDNTVRVWNTKTGKLVAGPFLGHSDWVYSVSFSPNGRWVVSGSRDNDIRVWDTDDNAAISAPTPASRCLKGHSSFVTTSLFSPDGQWIVSGSCDGTVCFWCFETGQAVTRLRTSEGQLSDQHKFWSATMSPAGDRIAAGTTGGLIYLWSRE